MQSIYEFITFTTKIEHDLEHDLTQKKLFSIPKIYTANGDKSKRWYVYFSFRDPKTGNLKRMPNIYGETNKYKTKEDRLSMLSVYRKRLIYLLKKGYNPFEDNAELHRNLEEKEKLKLKKQFHKMKLSKNYEKPKKFSGLANVGIATSNQQKLQQLVDDVKGIVEKVKNIPILNDNKEFLSSKNEATNNVGENNLPKNLVANNLPTNRKTISEAFDFAIQLKEKEVKRSTINDYKGKVKKFIDWIEKNQNQKKFIDEIKRKDFLDFLNAILLNTTARTRNNYRADLSSLFQILRNNELVVENFLKSIKVLKSKPEKHKKYTLQQQQEIFKYLETKDPILLLYIKFIFYGFLRPSEVSRLRIKDIDLENKLMRFQSKTKALKTKIIPDILLKSLPDLKSLHEESFLFTPHKIGADWNANDVNRRDHFTKRFGKVVKTKFELKEDYTLYSFRHTSITNLYNKLKKDLTDYEVKSKLMPITGHTTMVALEKYLRDIDADLPDDYSNLFKTDEL